MIDMQRIEEIRTRCEAATAGPWRMHDSKKGTEIHDKHTWGKGLSPFAVIEPGEWRNAEFIASSREDIPYLLGAIESLQTEILSLKDVAGRYEQLTEKQRKLMAEADGLEAELAESQRRERAAVEDLRGYCKACANLPKTLDFCEIAKPICKGCNKVIKQNWKWRGERSGK